MEMSDWGRMTATDAASDCKTDKTVKKDNEAKYSREKTMLLKQNEKFQISF